MFAHAQFNTQVNTRTRCITCFTGGKPALKAIKLGSLEQNCQFHPFFSSGYLSAGSAYLHSRFMSETSTEKSLQISTWEQLLRAHHFSISPRSSLIIACFPRKRITSFSPGCLKKAENQTRKTAEIS